MCDFPAFHKSKKCVQLINGLTITKKHYFVFMVGVLFRFIPHTQQEPPLPGNWLREQKWVMLLVYPPCSGWCSMHICVSETETDSVCLCTSMLACMILCPQAYSNYYQIKVKPTITQKANQPAWERAPFSAAALLKLLDIEHVSNGFLHRTDALMSQTKRKKLPTDSYKSFYS